MLNVVQIDRPETAVPENGYSTEEVHAMQRTVLNIFDRWGVTDVDAATVLGGISAKTFRRWKDGEYGRVNRDLADRMSHLLSIHRALRIIFTEPQAGYAWVASPNRAFAGQTPLDVMKRGGMEDLVRLRRYLDAARGGW